MKHLVVRINKDEYTKFMRIQLAKSWLTYEWFANKIWVCANTYYSWKYKKRIKPKHYYKLLELFWEEQGFEACFSITEEEHGNTKDL